MVLIAGGAAAPGSPLCQASPVTELAKAVSSSRDTGLDLLRGTAIVFVVVNHIDQPSLWQLLTVERVGLVTGAEIFVLLSGVVLGMVHARRTARAGWAASARTLLRRSLTLYVTSVVVVVTVLLLRYLPGVDAQALTTYTDGSTGQVYDLYAGAEEPRRLLRGIALLVYGPGQFNIMGLYVVLLAVAPLALYLLVRGWWPVLLLLSGAGFALAHLGVDRVLPSQFENSFSLLAWQVLFFLGMTVGFHRDGVAARLSPVRRRLLVGVASALAVALVALAWSSPFGLVPGPRLPLVPADVFLKIYVAHFDRRVLGVGRLLNVVALTVATYALLSRWRGGADNTATRSVVSLGRATLYVFVVHLALVLLVDDLAGGQHRGIVFGTLVHTLVVATLVAMVRRRVLFRVIPR